MDISEMLRNNRMQTDAVCRNAADEIDRLRNQLREERGPLADRVREALDRQSCPDAYMRIAYETILDIKGPGTFSDKG